MTGTKESGLTSLVLVWDGGVFNNCFSSFQLTDDKDWAIETLQNVNQQCQIEIVYNIAIWVIVGGELAPPEDVFGAICPADCSGHGKCNDGRMFNPTSSFNFLCLLIFLFLYSTFCSLSFYQNYP